MTSVISNFPRSILVSGERTPPPAPTSRTEDVIFLQQLSFLSNTIMSSLLERESSTPHISSYPKRSPLGALFSRTLPRYSGQYPVGVHDTELSIPKQSFGNFNHKSMPDAEAGLMIDTVMFTLFYPTTSLHDKNSQAVWFPRLVAI